MRALDKMASVSISLVLCLFLVSHLTCLTLAQGNLRGRGYGGGGRPPPKQEIKDPDSEPLIPDDTKPSVGGPDPNPEYQNSNDGADGVKDNGGNGEAGDNGGGADFSDNGGGGGAADYGGGGEGYEGGDGGESKEVGPSAVDPSAGEDYSNENGGSSAGDGEAAGGGGEQEGGNGNQGGEGCTCVPYYQCKDGDIVTDGSGIIDPRKKPAPKQELPLENELTPPFCGKFHVCCSAPSSAVTEKPYEHFCGIRKPNGLNKRILHSNKKGESEFGEWPWQAAILKVEGEANHFQCGAVLIDPEHVLTVAHCLYKYIKEQDHNPLPLVVRFGEWDTQSKDEFIRHEDYAVKHVIIHPDFRNTSLWNDIAVIKLDRPVSYAAHIDTICLPNYGDAFAEQECVVTGWGKDAYRHGHYSNILREVHVPVITNQKCQELLRKTRLGNYYQLHNKFMCAGGQENEDSCKGDGGGPLACFRKETGTYVLAGLVSWGIDCGMPYVPGVYMDVSKFLDWIKDSTGQPLETYWPKP